MVFQSRSSQSRYLATMKLDRSKGLYIPLRLLKSIFVGILLIGNLMRENPSAVLSVLNWLRRGFSSPAPQFVKWLVLKNWGGKETWIETGTYRGETTARLANFSNMVYSIEASPEFAKTAQHKFRDQRKVQILSGLSETQLPGLLKSLSVTERYDVSFWLDGHFSGENTFQGPSDTPIMQELETIAKHLNDFSLVSVLIDDVRCFDPSIPEYSSYPEITYLVNWANSHNLFWTVEHDIFIATNRRRIL